MKKLTVIIAAVVAGIFLLSQPSFAQGTAFTYQGSLGAGGHAANGTFDFQFTLFATSNSATALVGPLTISGVGVSNGLFMTTVDFGPGVFTSNSDWLSIAVRTNGASTFSALSPRQAVTSAPYAIYAANATTANTASTAVTANFVAAGGISSGTLADTRLSANVALRSGGNAFTGNQTVTAGSVGLGTIAPNYRLSLGPDSLNTKLAVWDGGTATTAMGLGAGLGQFRIHLSGSGDRFSFLNGSAGTEIMTLLGTGRLGLGTNAPQADFHVIGKTSFYTELLESADAGGTWLRLLNDSVGGHDWDFVSTGSGNAEGPGKLVIYDATAFANRVTLDTFGRMGIGNPNPSYPLDVSGDIRATGNVHVNTTNYAVGSSASNIRIVHGAVNYDGSLGNGAGYTASHTGTGTYTVTFQQPFAGGYPIVTVTPVASTPDAITAQISASSNTGFTVATKDSQFPTDFDFNFIAIGN